MKIKHFMLFATALVALVIALPIFAQSDDLTIVGGDEQSLRDALGFLIWAEPGSETSVIFGALPEDAEFVPSLPSDAHIVASVNRASPYNSSEIWILSNGTALESLDFYTQSLLENNWTVPEDMVLSPGGFVPQTNLSAGFCSPEADSFLWINIQERGTGTYIQMHLETQHIPPTCSGNFGNMMGSDPYRLLPRIETPEGVSIRDSRGGGGGGGGPYSPQSASSSIVLVTELAATDLRNLYDAQLEAADWNLKFSGGDETGAWSSWSFMDEDGNPWIGTLTMTALPDKDGEYYAVLYIEDLPQ